MGEAAALTTALGWAAASVALTSVAARLPTLAVSALQAAFACVILAVLIAATGLYADVAAASALTILAIIGSGVVGFSLAEPSYVRALSILGVQRTYPVAMGLFILLSTAGGVVILGERFTPGLVAGGALILGGAYLISAFRHDPAPPGGDAPAFPGAVGEGPPAGTPRARSHRTLGYILVAAVPIFWTSSTLLIAGAGASDEVGAISAAAVRVPAGTLPLLAFLLIARPRDLTFALRRRRDVVTMGAAGVTGIVIASLLFVYALFEAGAARTAVLTSSSPLFAMPLAIAFLGEPFTRWVALGTTLTVAGIIIVVTL